MQCGTSSPLPSNKTAQLNSLHCTKQQNEVLNVLHSKIYLKRLFKAKNKVYSSY